MNLLFALLLVFPKISINTAPLDSIAMLPIGYEDAESLAKHLNIPVEELLDTAHIPRWKAESIYAYREIHGPFESYYELSHVPGVNGGDIARWKPYIVVFKLKEKRDFAYYSERIRGRGAAEESPTESAMDEWISFFAEPINVNRATVDELYALDGVSLLDAAAVVRWARKLRIRHSRDLRRVPGLSYYGYRNMRDFVIYRDYEPRRITGWLHTYSAYWSEFYLSGSELSERVGELADTVRDSTLRMRLLEAGWDSAEVSNLLERLRSERNDFYSRRLFPHTRTKLNATILGRVQFGGLYDNNPYRDKPFNKRFIGLKSLGPIDRLLFGNFHIALGQGLMIDNTDDARSRTLWRPQGLYGDLSSTREFALDGVAAKIQFYRAFSEDILEDEGLKGKIARAVRGFSAIGFYSKACRSAVPDRSGDPIFYYADPFTPTAYKDLFKEKVVGASIRYDLPKPFTVGTQMALNFMEIERDRPLTFRFEDIDIPGDADSLSGDASFPTPDSERGRRQRFFGFELRTVYDPLSIEAEYAEEIGHGRALIVYSRLQLNTFYLDFHFRHYDADYLNPYSRPFYEATRFEDTPIEKPYRLIEPLASELQSLPMPKPETGFFVQTRYQITRSIIFPRVYIDLWRDNTDGLWNYRFQGEIEYRPIYALRLRLKQKIQTKRNLNKFGVSTSRTYESTFRIFTVLRGEDFIGMELRYGRVELSPRPTYREASIDGGFLSLIFNHTFGRKLQIKSGAAIWSTNGMSQWIFEDTGIDFLYGNGQKFYITFLERLSPNIGLKLKFRFKSSYFKHVGLYERPVYTPDGEPVYGFVAHEPYFSVIASLDYHF